MIDCRVAGAVVHRESHVPNADIFDSEYLVRLRFRYCVLFLYTEDS